MKKALLYFGILFLCSFNHPYYLSVTEIKYVTQDKIMQVSSKLFLNDLEAALSKLYKQPVDLINNTNDPITKKNLTDYLNKHIKLRINQQDLNFAFIGLEREEDTIWLFYEIKNCPAPKKIEIENTLLFDFIKDQTNLVFVEWNGKKQSSKLKNPDRNAIFE